MTSARRVIALGDELVAGYGDPRCLGWLGRVMARSGTAEDGAAILTLPLAVPSETTTALDARWQRELGLRVGGSTTHVVLALGAHDLLAGISLARSRLNLANVLDATTAGHFPTLVVGPPPRDDLDPRAQQELSTAFADVSARRRVPYVETYAPLVNHEQWQADLAAGDGIHPGQAGHGLLAWLVLHHGWHEWLGVPEPG